MTVLDDTHLQNDVDQFFIYLVGQTPPVDGALPINASHHSEVEYCPGYPKLLTCELIFGFVLMNFLIT